jgi:hypothetical protein
MNIEPWFAALAFGAIFLFIGATGKGVEGLNVRFGDVASGGARLLLGFAGVALFWFGFHAYRGDEPRSADFREPPTTSMKVAATSPQTTVGSSGGRSPEATIAAYFAALEGRDFETVRQFKPSGNYDAVRHWLEGGGTKSPISQIGLIEAERLREQPVDSSTEITIQVHVRYCRADNSGTDETKQYILSGSKGTWIIEDEGKSKDVDSIRC